MSALVDIESRGLPAVITLRREEKPNALSSELEARLSDACATSASATAPA